MIRRQRKETVKNGITYNRRSKNYNNIYENLPTSLITSPSCNGYFHVDVKQKNRYRGSRKKRQSKEGYNLNQIWIFVVVGILYCFCMSYNALSTFSRKKHRLHSPAILSLNNNFTIVFPAQRFSVQSPRNFYVPESLSTDDDEHDFGDLELRFPEFATSQDYTTGRMIYHDSYEDTGYEELWHAADDDGSIEYYYAFDDDEKRNPLVKYDDPDIHLEKKCRRTNWHRQLPITCNSIHEFNFQGHVGTGDTKYLGYVYSIASICFRIF